MAKVSTKIHDQEVADFMARIKTMEKGHQLDLSSDEDLSLAVMNLISIEEHLFFTAQKTGDSGYYDVLFEVREMRKTLMKMLIQDYEGEVWCTSKHLLAASMRCMEVGTKFLTKGDRQQAEEFFGRSYDLYNLFWGLNLKLVQKKDLKDLSGGEKKMIDEMTGEAGENFSQSLESCKLAATGSSKNSAASMKKVATETKATVTKTETAPDKSSVTQESAPADKKNLFSKLGQAVSHALDCCRE